MYNGMVQLQDIFDKGAFVDGKVPKITIVEPIHDESWDARCITYAHNLETYWFTTYYDENLEKDISFQDIVNSIDEFKEVGHYIIRISHSPEHSIQDADYVKDCSYDGTRLILFV